MKTLHIKPEVDQVRRAAMSALNGLAVSAPAVGGPILRQLFLTPRRLVAREEGHGGVIGTCRVGGQRVVVRAYGNGPSVALVHGWQGHMGQFVAMRNALVAAGFTAVTFDMPAHGATSGVSTNVGEFAETLVKVGKLVGPLHAVVAHSLGGPALGLALQRGLSVKGLVMVAPLISFDFALDEFSRMLGLSAQARELAAIATEQKVGIRRPDVDLMQMPVPEQPVMLIHDASDKRTLLEHTRGLHDKWKTACLIETQGLGHSRILRDESVLRDIVGFVSALPRETAYEVSDRLSPLPRFSF